MKKVQSCQHTSPITSAKPFAFLRLCIPIVGAFAVIVLPISFALAWYRETEVIAAANLVPAIVCGLIASLFVLVFHLKKETAVFPIKTSSDFLDACRAALKDLDCDVAQRAENSLVSWPSFRGLLLGGHIQIQAHGSEGFITGPRLIVDILRSRLRLQSHIAGIEQNIRDSRVRLRQAGRTLKRVEISLRIKPNQWSAAGETLIKNLLEAGAEVCCEVHLLAHSTDGIREAVVEGPIREWLQKEQIQAEIHKDQSCWDMKMAQEQSEDTVVVQTEQ